MYYCRVLKRERLISKFKIEDTAIKIPNSSGRGWTKIIHYQVLFDMFPNFDFDKI